MKKLLIATAATSAIFLALAAFPSWAADPPMGTQPPKSSSQQPSLSVRAALELSVALRNLDGHMIVVKQNGQDGTVMVPWEFASAGFRMRIAFDLTILQNVEQSFNTARRAATEEAEKKSGGYKPGSPEFSDLTKQLEKLLDEPAKGTESLYRIRASELKLDRNEIPITVLTALTPILDEDVH